MAAKELSQVLEEPLTHPNGLTFMGSRDFGYSGGEGIVPPAPVMTYTQKLELNSRGPWLNEGPLANHFPPDLYPNVLHPEQLCAMVLWLLLEVFGCLSVLDVMG